jgi:hypothetical protein
MRFNTLRDTNHNAKVLAFYEAQPKLGILDKRSQSNGIIVVPRGILAQ